MPEALDLQMIHIIHETAHLSHFLMKVTLETIILV